MTLFFFFLQNTDWFLGCVFAKLPGVADRGGFTPDRSPLLDVVKYPLCTSMENTFSPPQLVLEIVDLIVFIRVPVAQEHVA